MEPLLSTAPWGVYIRQAMNLLAAALRDPGDLIEVPTIIRVLQEIDLAQRMIPASARIDADVRVEFLYQRHLTLLALGEQLKSALQNPLLFLFGFSDFTDQTLKQLATYLEASGAFFASWIEIVPELAPLHLTSFSDVMQQFLLELRGEGGQQPFALALALFQEARHRIEDTK